MVRLHTQRLTMLAQPAAIIPIRPVVKRYLRRLVQAPTTLKGFDTMLTKRDLLRSAAVAVMAAPMVKSVPASAQSKVEWPNLLEAKDIAEEGFIYGLPLVMNYAVMQDFAVDNN